MSRVFYMEEKRTMKSEGGRLEKSNSCLLGQVLCILFNFFFFKKIDEPNWKIDNFMEKLMGDST